MYSQESVLELVDLVYAAACDSSKWDLFLEALCGMMGGSGGDIIAYDHEKPAVHFQGGIGVMGSEFQREYGSVQTYDPYVCAAKAVGFFRTGAIGLGETVLTTAKLKKTEFYNEFGKRYDYVGGVTGVIAAERTMGSAVSVCRRTSRAFGEAEVGLIRALMPHLQRALQVHTRLAEADAREGAFRDILNRIATGAALVDSDGRVLFINERARATLDERDGLSLDRHTLRTGRPRDTTLLLNLIRGAAETTKGEGSLSGGILLVGRPSRKRPLQIVVSPLSVDARAQHPNGARAIVFIVNPDSMLETDATLIRRLHSLSRAEADVARLLLEDKTPQEIGDKLCISINTVRFHLKHMLSKTGTRRQAELVRLLQDSSQIRRLP
jgi:DNA-binding CsgD family transcriptional regulator/PAS domain-containing protein